MTDTFSRDQHLCAQTVPGAAFGAEKTEDDAVFTSCVAVGRKGCHPDAGRGVSWGTSKAGPGPRAERTGHGKAG